MMTNKLSIWVYRIKWNADVAGSVPFMINASLRHRLVWLGPYCSIDVVRRINGPRAVKSLNRFVCVAADVDNTQVPRLKPVTPTSSVVSLKHISHILPTVYYPGKVAGMTPSSEGSIFFATGNKNKIKEVIRFSNDLRPHKVRHMPEPQWCNNTLLYYLSSADTITTYVNIE
jgi:hypothetical protein